MINFMAIANEEDRNKIEKIYISYRLTMFYAAKQILKDNALAEDAVSQTFVKLIQIIDDVDMEDSKKLRSFVVLITKRYAINIYNARKRNSVSSLEDAENIGELEDTTLNKIINEEDIVRLQKLISLLPDKYTDILKLKYAHEFNDREIAHILDLSEQNVRVRLHRARKMLKEKLQIHGKQEA